MDLSNNWMIQPAAMGIWRDFPRFFLGHELDSNPAFAHKSISIDLLNHIS